MDKAKRIEIIRSAPVSAGRTKLKKYLSGERITQRERIIVRCCDCVGYHGDGKADCKTAYGPLTPWMPYREK